MSNLIRYFFIVALIISPFASGCAKAVKPPEEFTRTKKVVSIMDDLNKTYNARNIYMFMDHVSRDFKDDYQKLRDAVSQTMDEFETIGLDIMIDRVHITNGLMKVSLHWEGNWIKRRAKESIKNKGNSVFILVGAEEIKLLVIEGDNPFVPRK